MENRRLTRNTRGLNKNALEALRRAPPPPMRPARARINAVDPNVARLYAEMFTRPINTTRKNNSARPSYTPFYPNAPNKPGPGSLAYKRTLLDPRHVSSVENRIKTRRNRRRN
jgi:hypothetical protein